MVAASLNIGICSYALWPDSCEIATTCATPSRGGVCELGQRAKTNRERCMLKAVWMIRNLIIWGRTVGYDRHRFSRHAAFPTTFNNPIGID
jgi:hypothetical protein